VSFLSRTRCTDNVSRPVIRGSDSEQFVIESLVLFVWLTLRISGTKWPLNPVVRRLLQPLLNLFPGIKILGKVSRLVGETIECDEFLLRIWQTPCLPAAGCLRDP